jgi:hypothetical protein
MVRKLLIGGLVVIVLGVGAVVAYDLLRGESTLAYQLGRETSAQTGGAGRGYGNRTAGEASQEVGPNRESPLSVAEPQAEVDAWLTLSGVVQSVDVNAMTLTTADGEKIEIQLGPEPFWSEQGVALEPGAEVTVTAFDEEGSLTAGEIVVTATSEQITLRDADGRPQWSGGPGAGQGAADETPAGAPVENVPGRADGEQVPQPQSEVAEWITVQGTVTAVDLNALMIETVDGEMMAVQLGPEHYWTAQGLTLAAGDKVEVTGFYEDGTSFNAGSVTLLDSGATLALRDTDGRPLWAGGPGQGGNGQGGGRAASR